MNFFGAAIEEAESKKITPIIRKPIEVQVLAVRHFFPDIVM
jgi:hypothetical protein